LLGRSGVLMLAAIGLAAMLLPRRALVAEDGRSSPPPPTGQANPNPGPEDPYWTPERLLPAAPGESGCLPVPGAPPQPGAGRGNLAPVLLRLENLLEALNQRGSRERLLQPHGGAAHPAQVGLGGCALETRCNNHGQVRQVPPGAEG
jgi:hypothetical protein